MPKQIFQRQPQPKRMKMGRNKGIPGQSGIPNQPLPKKVSKEALPKGPEPKDGGKR